MSMYKAVVPWVHEKQIDLFLTAWQLERDDPRLILQHDKNREGCAAAKNRGVQAAKDSGAEVVIVLDDDCFPAENRETDETFTFDEFVEAHLDALEPVSVQRFATVTMPPSRGTPYSEVCMTMPVACSMGFWTEIGDYCGVRQLAFNAAEMSFDKRPIFGQYFPLCGMNIAFRVNDWLPWCKFINVDRFDDIWMGWLWQREAYRRGFCFNLAGPMIRHARQSNVWKNLAAETLYLCENETLWREIANADSDDYETLKKLLPAG